MSDDAASRMKAMTTQAAQAATKGAETAQEMGRQAMERGMAGMAEFSRMFAGLKFPGVPDMESLLASHRRNMEVLSAANRVALEGAQTVAKRHMEIVQQTMHEMTESMKDLTTPENPQARAAKQAELVKGAYERAVAHMKELADLIQRSNGEAMGMLNQRFAEAMDEVKHLAQKSGATHG